MGIVQIMSDDEHLELDFDPLDPTKIWPVDTFPLPIGRMVLKNPTNYFAEVEQVAFGTGVVDGLEFSDDKLLQGRTFSYSDTQPREQITSSYLINQPKQALLRICVMVRWLTTLMESKARTLT